MKRLLAMHPVALVGILFFLQIFAFGYLIIGTWGGGTDAFQAIGIIVILYEILCLILFFTWLWAVALALQERLANNSIFVELFYFKTFYFTLLAIIILLCANFALFFLSGSKHMNNDVTAFVKDHVETITIIQKFLRAIILYVTIGCFYFIFSWIRSIEFNKKVSIMETIPYLVSMLFLPAAVFLVQYKVRKLLEPRWE